MAGQVFFCGTNHRQWILTKSQKNDRVPGDRGKDDYAKGDGYAKGNDYAKKVR